MRRHTGEYSERKADHFNAECDLCGRPEMETRLRICNRCRSLYCADCMSPGITGLCKKCHPFDDPEA